MSHNPPQRHDAASLLETLAIEARRIAALPGPNRTTAVVRLILAAEKAGISRRDAEKVVRDAFGLYLQ